MITRLRARCRNAELVGVFGSARPLRPVNTGGRASLDEGWRRGESMDMEDRIAVLEKDVDAIKSELAVIRHDRALAFEMSARVSRIELDLAVVKGDVSHLRRDVSLLQGDVSQLRKDVSDLHKRLAQLEGAVENLRNDMARLRDDFAGLRDGLAGLQKGFANMQEAIVGIRLEMVRMNTEHLQFATKTDVRAEVKSLEAKMKGWMLAITLSLMTSIFAMIYPLYGLLRNPPVVKPALAQQIVSPATAAPASLK